MTQIITSALSAHDKPIKILSDPGIQASLRAAFSDNQAILSMLDFVQSSDTSSSGCQSAGVQSSFCGVLADLEQGHEISSSTLDALAIALSSGGDQSIGGDGGIYNDASSGTAQDLLSS